MTEEDREFVREMMEESKSGPLLMRALNMNRVDSKGEVNMSLKDDGVFAAALIGVVMCALSFALLLYEGGTMWVLVWLMGIAFVGFSIGFAYGKRGE